MSLESALGKHAAPVTMEWRGRTLALQPLSWKLISGLGRKLIQRESDARTDSLYGMVERGMMTPEALAERIEAFVDDAVNNGRYGFGSPRMTRILAAAKNESGEADPATLEGKLILIALILGVEVDDAINLMHERGVELAMKLAQVLGESMPPKEAGAAA